MTKRMRSTARRVAAGLPEALNLRWRAPVGEQWCVEATAAAPERWMGRAELDAAYGADGGALIVGAYAEEEEREMRNMMKDMGVNGFPMAVLTHDATEGKAYAIQCAGLGPLTPNTVLMGWP